MSAAVLIVGQGVAGTLLAWELERNGADFEIADSGHEPAASRIAAGIINPITGQRLVKSWRTEELLPFARETYRELERELGVPLWREMRVRRQFADDAEREIFAAREARGELAPYLGPADRDGFWIEGAAQVDLPQLLAAARQRWRARGRLREEPVRDLAEEASRRDVVVLASGAALMGEAAFAFVPWSVAKGEQLVISTAGLAPNVILNRGHWVLPLGANGAKVGATYLPGVVDRSVTVAARAQLEESSRRLLAEPFVVQGQEAGLRLTTPDRRPVAGRSPLARSLGILGGLGSKGASLAPWLARQWWNSLSEGVPFDPTIDVTRFWRG
jgi:glycine/D-amino acid oxidase-like deaminating enzyme